MERPTKVNGVDVPYNATVPELLRAASRPGPDAWASLVALGHHDSDEAYDALLQRAASPDWRYRRAALESLAYHARSASAHNLFCAALADESSYVVRTACRIVGEHRIASAHPGVCRLLGSSDESTRQVAAAAMANLWTDDDFDRVRNVSRQDSSLNVRREAAWSLRRNVSPATWRQLVELWARDELPRHRVWACELASEFGDESVKKEINSLSDDSDGHVRKAANAALGRIEARSTTTPTRTPMVRKGISSGDMIAVLIASAVVGLVGFGLFFVDFPGPLLPIILTPVLVGGSACAIATLAPKRWALVGVLCSWGSVLAWLLGMAAEIPGFLYAVVGLPAALVGSYAGSHIHRVRGTGAV